MYLRALKIFFFNLEKYLEALFRLVTLLIRVNVKFIFKVSKCIIDIIDVNDRDSTPARLLLMGGLPIKRREDRREVGVGRGRRGRGEEGEETAVRM